MREIEWVAVLGAGTMGSRIAAHFANAGVSVLLLDLPSAGVDPNELAKRGIENALRQRPAGFFTEATASLVRAGNFDEHLPQIGECQWVLEAVAENLEIKRALWTRAADYASPEAILSTNTSGLRLSEISTGLPDSLQRRFLGTHFFNPPRYLHLLEVIPAANTSADVASFVQRFAEFRLGKGIVLGKDTPNFIANRIGSFYSAAIQRAMVELDLTIEEVDVLTGPLIGFPKSASFRLIDVIGLDIWTTVMQTSAHGDETWGDWFQPLPYVRRMLENRWLGDKTGQGFYKRVGSDKQIQVLDWKTLGYRTPHEVKFESVEAVRKIPVLEKRLQVLMESSDKAGVFLNKIFHAVYQFSTMWAPSIANSIVDIDRAMRWGFGHQLGPFELTDCLGYGTSYRNAGLQPDISLLKRLSHVDQNADASLIDLGDSVLCLEFHSKMNAIGDGTLEMMERGLALLEKDFRALVIANEGENFSAGANLVVLLNAMRSRDFGFIERFVRRFQQAMLGIKYAAGPVVSAAFSRALGGGCEVVLQSTAVQAFAELNIGLVELGVGLIPSAGGTKEMALRFPNPCEGLRLILETKVSGSAAEAKEMGFLRAQDRVTMNPDHLIADAKQYALKLAESGRNESPLQQISSSGDDGYQQMLQFASTKNLSEHDLVIAEKLAYVLSGGRTTVVSEQKLLDLELEAFLSLCGMPKSIERVEYMLKHGKPLRN